MILLIQLSPAGDSLIWMIFLIGIAYIASNSDLKQLVNFFRK